MSDGMKIILAVIATAAGITLVVFLVIGLFTVVKNVLTHIFRFVGSEVSDVFRTLGSIVTGVVYALLLLGNIVIGRWSAAAHFGRGVRDEFIGGSRALYRVAIGNPARFLLMRGLVEGIEDRLPAMVQAAPGTDAPSKRTGQFEGYKILGSLPTGGSGSKLYIADPDEIKRAGFERAGHAQLNQVVIKSFSLSDGSSLPQIVRESRALDAAMKLGLILDHDLSSERFFYVMRYVPGQNLTLVTKQLHAASAAPIAGSAPGLDEKRLRLALGYVADLLRTLERYHQGGLWHKDVKPDNIIVDNESAHLVDFGLVTPLRSAMTLTTHGTEYFRDPEMVRQALKGVKVHEVDGTRFDIFGAGAVLYAILEDAFPAHGVLSPITKSCPEALKWVVRRAMTDYDKRYPTAYAMLADVEAVRAAAKPFEMRPVDLPSMRSGADVPPIPLEVGAPAAVASVAQAASPVPPAENADSSGMAQPSSDPSRFDRDFAHKPRIVVENWWTGRSRVEQGDGTGKGQGVGSASGAFAAARHAASRLNRSVFGGFAAAGAASASPRRTPPSGPRRPAKEQVAAARARMMAARARAEVRLSTRHLSNRDYSNGVKGAVALVVVLFLGAVLGLVATSLVQPQASVSVQTNSTGAPQNPAPEFPAATNFSGQAAFVISDLDALDPEATQEARRGLTLLKEQGLKLAGLPVDALLGNGDLALPTAEIDEMAATLRLSRGQTTLDSQTAVDGVRAWLLKHSEQFDMVIWLSKEPGGQGKGGLFHFITFKDSAKPGTIGYTARQLIDGIIAPGKNALDVTIQSGKDLQNLLDELGKRIASAKQSVDKSLADPPPGEGPPSVASQPGISSEARDYVLRLVADAGKILSAVRTTIEGSEPQAKDQPNAQSTRVDPQGPSQPAAPEKTPDSTPQQTPKKSPGKPRRRRQPIQSGDDPRQVPVRRIHHGVRVHQGGSSARGLAAGRRSRAQA